MTDNAADFCGRSLLFLMLFCSQFLFAAPVDVMAPMLINDEVVDEALVYLFVETETGVKVSVVKKNIRVYVVEESEELHQIARKVFGRGAEWRTLYELNQGIVTSRLEKVKKGTELKVPLEFDVIDENLGAYRTRPGDNLHNISRRLYGDFRLWKKIYEWNKEKIKNVNQLEVDITLNFELNHEHVEKQESEEKTEKIDRILVEAGPVIRSLEERATPEYLKQFVALKSFYEGEEFFNVGQLNEAGFPISFDNDDVALIVSVPPDFRTEELHSLKRRRVRIEGQEVLPLDFSAYANFFATQNFGEESDGGYGRQPLSIGSDFNIHLYGLALVSQYDYSEDDEEKVKRIQSQLVYDFPDDLVRFQLGDQFFQISRLQGTERTVGLSVSTEFGLDPLAITTPTFERTFFLKNDSEVTVVQNGRELRRLNLRAGTHSIEDLVLSPGVNEVELYIRDQSGREERLVFPVTTNPILLRKKLHQFSYNVGAMSELDDLGELQYSDDRLVWSLFHRYGMTNSFTLGGSLQGTEGLVVIGSELLFAVGPGLWGLDLSASQFEDFNLGSAALLSYTYEGSSIGGGRALNWFSFLEYTDSHYVRLGEIEIKNFNTTQLSSNIDVGLSKTLTLQLSGSHTWQVARSSEEETSESWDLSAGVSSNVRPGLTMRVTGTLSSNFDRELETVGQFSLTWRPGRSHTVFYQTDTDSREQSINYTYSPSDASNRWRTNARLSSQGDSQSSQLGASYRGNRGNMTANHAMARGTDGDVAHSSFVSGSFSLSYADGLVALGPSIQDSFLLVEQAGAREKEDINVNQSADGSYLVQANDFGPAVVASPRAYNPFVARLDKKNPEEGASLSPERVTFVPRFKSGGVVRPNETIRLMMEGLLTQEDGSPVVFKALKMISTQDRSLVFEMFTEDDGYFFVEGPPPGEYLILSSGVSGARAKVVLPDEVGEIIDLGTIVLK